MFPLARFRFFGAVVRSFAPLPFAYISITHRPHLDIPKVLPMTLSEFITIARDLLVSFTVCMRLKMYPARPFVDLFASFLLPSLPLRPFAPTRINLYPSTPILDAFCLTSQNIMSGEISPFWRVTQKASRMGVDGYRLIRVGANGRRGKEGSKNEAKRATNGRAGDVFRRVHTMKKTSKSRVIVIVLGEDLLGDFRESKG